MEDPFKIGLKAFFGVATGVGILFLTFNLIQSIDYSINNFIENQEQKQREKERIKRIELENQRKKERIKRIELENQRKEKYQEQERIKRLNYFNKTGKPYRPPWMEEKIKGCYLYPTKKQIDYCINVYSPFGK
tara:strand:- start:30 stop:428 length:399 start_codon:yes stop_codon:yes gene_type:complete